MKTFFWTSLFWIVLMVAFWGSGSFEPYYFSQIVPSPVVNYLKQEVTEDLEIRTKELMECINEKTEPLIVEGTEKEEIVNIDLEEFYKEFELLSQRVIELEEHFTAKETPTQDPDTLTGEQKLEIKDPKGAETPSTTDKEESTSKEK